jgi:ribosomal protein S12 methylthiotransferase accessory factor
MTPKAFMAGTHRTVAPEDTLARVAPLLAGMGITRIGTLTGLDVIGVPVVVCVRPLSRTLAVSQGKGLTLAAARVSAVMESAEQHAAERIALPLVYGTVADLAATHRLLDVSAWPRESAHEGAAHPELWIEGIDLLQEQAVWVPFDLVHTRYTWDACQASPAYVTNTSGLAAGNHLLEALSHALCELIERDATHGRAGTADEHVDLDTVDDAACRSVIEACAAAHVLMGAWDMTGETGLPVFAAVAIDADDDTWRAVAPAHGTGCHPSRAIALLRALTEAIQGRATAIAGVREDIPWEDYQAFRDPERRARLRALCGKNGARRFQAAPTTDFETFDEDLRWLLLRLRARGLPHVVAVDVTHDVRIPVVRAVVPGLGIGARWGEPLG